MIPSFVKRAQPSAYLSETFSQTRALARELVTEPVREGPAVTLVDYDGQAEERIIAAILYPHVTHPLSQLRELAARLPDERKQAVLDTYMKGRRHRREKPGRALEQVYYTFDIIGNLGVYRDLQRHRLLSQERQDFTTAHGYDTPPEITEAGFDDDYRRCMDRAAEIHERVSGGPSAGGAVPGPVRLSHKVVHEDESAEAGTSANCGPCRKGIRTIGPSPRRCGARSARCTRGWPATPSSSTGKPTAWGGSLRSSAPSSSGRGNSAGGTWL